MCSETFNSLAHQLIVMARDPIVYLAIDERSAIFSPSEKLAIRLAKVYAHIATLQLNETLQAANALMADLKASDCKDCVVMNLFAIAAVYFRKGNYEFTQARVSEALNFLTEESSKDLRGFASVFLMWEAMHRLEDVSKDLAKFSEDLQEIKHPFFRALVLRALGKIHLARGQYEIAQDFFSAAYEVANQNKLTVNELEISNDLILVCGYMNKKEMGERFFEIASRTIGQLRLPDFKASVFFNYGRFKAQIEDYPAAVHFFKESLLEMKNRSQYLPMIEYDCYNLLAFTLNKMGEADQALEYQLKAEKLIEASASEEIKVDMSLNVALILISLGRWDEALRRLNEARSFYQKYAKKDKEIQATRALVSYYEKRNKQDAALAALKELDALNIGYISELREAHSRYGESKFKEITADSKALREKYDRLVLEVTKRQSARFTGKSEASRRVIDSSILAAMHLDANVLIQGANGTGKEVVAQMIHFNSRLKNQPFVKVNCALIRASDFEKEFFGFIPAEGDEQQGEIESFFEQAGQGTLFLDEVSEIPYQFQKKLLNALDAKSYTPAGSNLPRPISCRIISSTQQDMMELFKKNRFRIDLLNRLNTLEIKVPALKERTEDIPMLVEVFVHEFARETAKRVPTIKASFYERLDAYDFPGNVRELKNIIERIFILYYEEQWTGSTLDNIYALSRAGQLKGKLLEHDIEELDKERIIEALKKTKGKQKTAAKLLNMTESTLCRKIKRYDIKKHKILVG